MSSASGRWRPCATMAVPWLFSMVVLLGSGKATANVRVLGDPTGSAAAGSYATLLFPLEGNGTYDVEIEPPTGWTLVTRADEIALNGTGYLSVTLRVPDLTPAGERFPIGLRLLDAEGNLTSAEGFVEVTRTADIAMQTPGELEGVLGHPLVFDIVVSNEGNARDTIHLLARHTHWDVAFDQVDVHLEPGERRRVRVTLRPTTRSNNGVRHIFRLEAISANDPDAVAAAEVVSRFYERGSIEAVADDRPRISMHVRTAAAVGLDIAGGNVEPSLKYSLAPSVSGELSDFVEGEASTNTLAGTMDAPFAQLPSSFSISLDGPNWSGSVDAGPRRYAVDAVMDLQGWKVSGGGSVSPGDIAGAVARIESNQQHLDLAVTGRTSFHAERRTDSLTADYTVPLVDNVELALGATASGFAGSTGGDGYEVALGATQRLTYEEEAFDVTQSYSGVPLAGIHTVGLSGGTRVLQPLAVRARTSYSVSPVANRWTSGATIFASPGAGITADVTGEVSVDNGAALGGVTYSVSPRVGWSGQPSDSLSVRTVARYGHGGVLSGSGTTWSLYQAGAQLGYLDFSLSAGAKYEVRVGSGDPSPESSLEATANASYNFASLIGVDSLLSATYSYEERYSNVTRVRHDLEVGWQHVWTPSVASKLSYERSIDPIGESGQEGMTLGLGFNDLFTPGLQLSAFYGISTPTSLLDFGAPYSHEIRIGLGYDLLVSFDTPRPIVDLFGGRRGGQVEGVAFIDQDLDGARDPHEEALAGVVVSLGSESATTDASGRYSMRVPDGQHEFDFPTGLPATVDLIGERRIDVEEDEIHQRPLAFAPVVSLTVHLFDDVNNNQVWDEGEGGIPFGGLVFEGPERRVVRTDGAGQAIVSGIVTGLYTILVSADHLPQGYRPTTDPVQISFRPDKRPEPLLLGAARPPRDVVTTFSRGALAIMPRALTSMVPRGAELEVEVLVQGEAERLVLVHQDRVTDLLFDGRRWLTRVRIPSDTPIGPLELRVRAEGAGRQVERPLFINVIDQPPFTATSVIVAVESEAELAVQTLFLAEEASVTMPDGQIVELTSADGYDWTGTWRAPLEASRSHAVLRVDGEELGEIPVAVVAPPSESATVPDHLLAAPDSTGGEGEADSAGRGSELPGTIGRESFEPRQGKPEDLIR